VAEREKNKHEKREKIDSSDPKEQRDQCLIGGEAVLWLRKKKSKK